MLVDSNGPSEDAVLRRVLERLYGRVSRRSRAIGVSTDRGEASERIACETGAGGEARDGRELATADYLSLRWPWPPAALLGFVGGFAFCFGAVSLVALLPSRDAAGISVVAGGRASALLPPTSGEAGRAGGLAASAVASSDPSLSAEFDGATIRLAALVEAEVGRRVVLPIAIPSQVLGLEGARLLIHRVPDHVALFPAAPLGSGTWQVELAAASDLQLIRYAIDGFERLIVVQLVDIEGRPITSALTKLISYPRMIETSDPAAERRAAVELQSAALVGAAEPLDGAVKSGGRRGAAEGAMSTGLGDSAAAEAKPIESSRRPRRRMDRLEKASRPARIEPAKPSGAASRRFRQQAVPSTRQSRVPVVAKGQLQPQPVRGYTWPGDGGARRPAVSSAAASAVPAATRSKPQGGTSPWGWPAALLGGPSTL